MRQRNRAIAAATAAILMLSFTSAQAAAAAPHEPDVDLRDAQSIVEEIAPTLVGAPGEKSALDISTHPDGAQGREAPQIKASSMNGGAGTAIGVDYVDASTRLESGEFTVFESATSGIAAYVHPTHDGVQIITAIASANAPDSFSYTLDVPAGTDLVSAHDGLVFNLVDPAGDRIGLLAAPWAVDSTGRSLPTSFTWEGTTLTQHVDFSGPAIRFPVIADPDWQYGVDYSLGSASPGSAWAQLHSCLSCYLPIEGAPAVYPSDGSDLPLVVRFATVVNNFHCTMGSTYNSMPSGWGWYFAAADGHIDGRGSAIFFDVIRNRSTGQTRLWVGGIVHNDFPGGLPNPLYVTFAAAQWAGFAQNLSL